MPMRSEFDTTRRVVLTFGTGEITDDELKDHHVAMFGDPAFDPGFDQLADFRGAIPRVSSETVRMIARRSRFASEARRAFVVSSEVAFGLGRMFELSLGAEAETVRLFEDIDEARAWLGLTPSSSAL